MGCCVSSYYLIGWVSRSELLGVVENVRFGYLHPPPIVAAFSGGVYLFVRLEDCVLCLYDARASGTLSLSIIAESSCHASHSEFHRLIVPCYM